MTNAARRMSFSHQGTTATAGSIPIALKIGIAYVHLFRDLTGIRPIRNRTLKRLCTRGKYCWHGMLVVGNGIPPGGRGQLLYP